MQVIYAQNYLGILYKQSPPAPKSDNQSPTRRVSTFRCPEIEKLAVTKLASSSGLQSTAEL
jgi:hypothetical protein